MNLAVIGQKITNVNTDNKIVVQAKDAIDSVIIRWAPTNPRTWLHANNVGYKIYRYTLTHNGRLLKNVPNTKILIDSMILPKPLNEWEKIANQNKYAAITAQAIYGGSFNIEIDAPDIFTIINKSKELENRYSFALLSADHSIEVARLSGLCFVDKNIRSNEEYLYKICVAKQSKQFTIDTGFVFVEDSMNLVLPKPADIQARFEDRLAVINWSNKYMKDVFSSYILERSDDNEQFEAINNEPIVAIANELNPKGETVFYYDSLPVNYKTYFYRVRGKNIFGDISPPSDTIFGMGQKHISVAPNINEVEIIDNKLIKINWHFPDSFIHLVNGFDILVSTNIYKDYKVINKELLPASQKKYAFKTSNNVNYIIVRVSIEEKVIQSNPVLAQLIDKKAPKPPIDIRGEIDSTGLVHLIWQANSENDLLGYRVYRAFNLNNEFSQITKGVININKYSDSVYIETLTKNVFYKVVAVDYNFNFSDFSEVLKLKRPDIIPPIPPVFSGIKATDSCIIVKWNKSPSKDIKTHILYRKHKNNWYKVTESDTNVYYDYDTRPELLYKYRITAIDNSLNKSDCGTFISAQPINKAIIDIQFNLKSKIDREEHEITLIWEQPKKAVKKYIIYKSSENQPLHIVAYLNSDLNYFSDSNLTINTIYKYRIRAEFKDGTSSTFSKILTIKY